jgi:hypothetical protein
VEAILSRVQRLSLGGHTLAVDGGVITYDGEPITARELTRRYPAEGRVWAWLREHGVRRVSTTSGPSGQRRGRPARTISMSAEHSARLDALAERLGTTVSAVVERSIDELERLLAASEK